MIKLSIIIVSYNNLEVIIDCLDSAIRMNDIGEELEIIVVEQSTNNYIYNYLKQHYSKITVIRSENKGFGVGNNLGSEVAQGKYLLFLNSDTIIIEPIAQFAINQFSKNPSLGLFGVCLLDKNKKKNSSFDCIIPFSFSSMILSSICKQLDLFIEGLMYIQGADIFIRSDLFRKIGRFDENIFLYFEEPDICIRVKKEGYHIKYFKNKKIIHLGGASSSNNNSQSTIRMLKSFKYFCCKYNINYIKYIKEEIIYLKVKLFFYKLFKPDNNIEIEQINRIINSFLQTL